MLYNLTCLLPDVAAAVHFVAAPGQAVYPAVEVGRGAKLFLYAIAQPPPHALRLCCYAALLAVISQPFAVVALHADLDEAWQSVAPHAAVEQRRLSSHARAREP